MNPRRRRLAKAKRHTKRRDQERESRIRQLEMKGYQVIRHGALR